MTGLVLPDASGRPEPGLARDETGRPAIRVMTWNIHGAVGFDRRCDPERVFAIVERQTPDILALQEVDGRSHLGRRPRAFESVAERFGLHIAEARLVRRADRDYGHLLWSRWPFERADVELLPGGRFERRAVIKATVVTPQGRLSVLATHLGLLAGDRRRQAVILAAHAAQATLPMLALGDFNDWRLSGPVHRALGSALPVQHLPRTWPAVRPAIRMDRIYASADIDLAPVPCEAGVWRASDHRPVVADIRIVRPRHP